MGDDCMCTHCDADHAFQALDHQLTRWPRAYKESVADTLVHRMRRVLASEQLQEQAEINQAIESIRESEERRS